MDTTSTPASPQKTRLSLVSQISIGLVLGIGLALLSPAAAKAVGLLGTLFISALKAVAPVLVLVLVMSSIANHQHGQQAHIRPVLLLYLIGTLGAALTAVAASLLFPTALSLNPPPAQATAPGGIVEVLHNVLVSVVSNPVAAVLEANFIGILAWAVILGIGLRSASPATRAVLNDFSEAVSGMVRLVIRFAPFGIFGLVASTLAESGLRALLEYAQLLLTIAGSMFFVALVLNPFIVWWKLRRNPYPLVLTCLRESGITAFFTRSSAANIPINLELCKRLGIDENTYSIAIPLGATINMAGAAVTITVMTLAATHTLGIEVDFASAIMLSVIAALAACGTSGVAGGSLLLIPMACALFGMDMDVAMQVVAIGFIIGVVQDSLETALNSSTDVVFTAAACGVQRDRV